MKFKVGDKIHIEKTWRRVKRQFIFTIKRINSDKTYDIENDFFIFKNVPEEYLGEKL